MGMYIILICVTSENNTAIIMNKRAMLMILAYLLVAIFGKYIPTNGHINTHIYC
jgi:hypothetical protein